MSPQLKGRGGGDSRKSSLSTPLKRQLLTLRRKHDIIGFRKWWIRTHLEDADRKSGREVSIIYLLKTARWTNALSQHMTTEDPAVTDDDVKRWILKHTWITDPHEVPKGIDPHAYSPITRASVLRNSVAAQATTRRETPPVVAVAMQSVAEKYLRQRPSTSTTPRPLALSTTPRPLSPSQRDSANRSVPSNNADRSPPAVMPILTPNNSPPQRNPSSTAPNPPSTAPNPPSTAPNPQSTAPNLPSTAPNPQSTAPNLPSTALNPSATSTPNIIGCVNDAISPPRDPPKKRLLFREPVDNVAVGDENLGPNRPPPPNRGGGQPIPPPGENLGQGQGNSYREAGPSSGVVARIQPVPENSQSSSSAGQQLQVPPTPPPSRPQPPIYALDSHVALSYVSDAESETATKNAGQALPMGGLPSPNPQHGQRLPASYRKQRPDPSETIQHLRAIFANVRAHGFRSTTPWQNIRPGHPYLEPPRISSLFKCLLNGMHKVVTEYSDGLLDVPKMEAVMNRCGSVMDRIMTKILLPISHREAFKKRAVLIKREIAEEQARQNDGDECDDPFMMDFGTSTNKTVQVDDTMDDSDMTPMTPNRINKTGGNLNQDGHGNGVTSPAASEGIQSTKGN